MGRQDTFCVGRRKSKSRLCLYTTTSTSIHESIQIMFVNEVVGIRHLIIDQQIYVLSQIKMRIENVEFGQMPNIEEKLSDKC